MFFKYQIREVYENYDPKSKDFLYELADFMHLRGTPIYRFPVMANQTLDLFELYKLVCESGGVLEVIKKKVWPDIVKKLNIPSSSDHQATIKRIDQISPNALENRSSDETFPLNGASILSGFEQSPLASLLYRQNLLIRYKKMAEEQRQQQQEKEDLNLNTVELEREEPMVSIHSDFTLTPKTIKRERETDEEDEESRNKRVKLECRTPELEEDKQTHIAQETSVDMTFMGGLQFDLKKDENGQLKISLSMNGVRYESDLKVVS